MGATVQVLWAGKASPGQLEALRAAATVNVAPSVAEAIRAANEAVVDAVVIDVQGLGQEAFALLRQLKGRPSGRYQPLVCWGGEALKVFEAGADDWVDAAATTAELQARLERHLALRSRIDGLLGETERLAELSLTDALTQVSNHRHFHERLGDELRRAQRYDDPLALILVDLDLFKSVNDTHGHLVGDEVLKEVARAIRSSVRETDFVARYGGEEFAVVLPKTQLAGGLTVAERVWREVGALKMGASKVLRITVSLGMSGFPSRSVTTPEQLVRCADEALYRAKREGRNKIAIYQPPLAEAG